MLLPGSKSFAYFASSRASSYRLADIKAAERFDMYVGDVGSASTAKKCFSTIFYNAHCQSWFQHTLGILPNGLVIISYLEKLVSRYFTCFRINRRFWRQLWFDRRSVRRGNWTNIAVGGRAPLVNSIRGRDSSRRYRSKTCGRRHNGLFLVHIHRIFRIAHCGQGRASPLTFLGWKVERVSVTVATSGSLTA